MNDILTAVLYPPAVTVRLRPCLIMHSLHTIVYADALSASCFKVSSRSFPDCLAPDGSSLIVPGSLLFLFNAFPCVGY